MAMPMRLQSWQVSSAPFPVGGRSPVSQGTSCAAREQLMRHALPGRMTGSASASPAALRGAGAGQQKSHSASVVPSGVRYQVPQPQAAAQTTRARPPPQEFTSPGQAATHSLQRRHTQAQSTPPGGSHSSILQQQQQQHQQQGQQQLRGPQQANTIHSLRQSQENALQQLGVQYHGLPKYGGSTSSSAPQRGGAAKKKRRYDRCEDDSDDDVIGPGLLFSQEKLKLLVTAITFIRNQIWMQANLPVPEVCRPLHELFREEQYYHGKPLEQVHKYREGLDSIEKGVVARFILDILDSGFFDVSELICCLVYLRRLAGRIQLRLRADCWRPLFVTALLFADKVTEDKSVKNSSMCELFPVLHESQLFELEVAFLKELDFMFLVDRVEFQAFCKELLTTTKPDLEVDNHVREHVYIKSDTFTWIDSDAPGQQQPGFLGQQQNHRPAFDNGAPNIYGGQASAPGWRQSGASCPVGTAQRSHSGSAGTSSRVAPQPQWNTRRTLHSTKRNGQASATVLHPATTPPGSATPKEDDQMDKTPPMPQDSEAEHNRKAELNGVSPRRVKVTGYDNGGLGAAHRSPRPSSDALETAGHSQSQSRVGELGEHHLAQAGSSGMLHQAGSSPAGSNVRQRVADWPGAESSSRPRLAANQSPRRALGSSGPSGPSLRSGGGHTPTAQVQQIHRQEASPRADQDPSTLSFVEKKELYAKRAESAPTESSRASGAGCRTQQMPAGHSQSQVLNRGGLLRPGQQAGQVHQHGRANSQPGIVSGGMAMQGAQGGPAAYGGYPMSRSTIPNTRAAGSAARPVLAQSPAGIVAGGVPGRVQQGGHAQAQVGMSQGQVLQAARGRSSSPAYTGGLPAQPYSPARQQYMPFR